MPRPAIISRVSHRPLRWLFLEFWSQTALISSIRLLSIGCAMLYYMLDGQLFLRLYLVHCTQHIKCSAVSSASTYTSQTTWPYDHHKIGGVTHVTNHSMGWKHCGPTPFPLNDFEFRSIYYGAGYNALQTPFRISSACLYFVISYGCYRPNTHSQSVLLHSIHTSILM